MASSTKSPWVRKYVDLAREVADLIPEASREAGVSQKQFIADAITAHISTTLRKKGKK